MKIPESPKMTNWNNVKYTVYYNLDAQSNFWKHFRWGAPNAFILAATVKILA